MAIFRPRSARHRAEATSHLVRNTTIAAAAAGAAIIGSVAPAQASASRANDTPYTYQAPVLQQSTSAASLTPQVTASGQGATIAAAALGQLGVGQDCTALVSNALRAVGIDHRGWPGSYLSLGTQVSAGQAQPGDLVYYADGGMGAAHIGVYIGGGKAVHGGWNGYQTVVGSVNVGSGPVYLRVR